MFDRIDPEKAYCRVIRPLGCLLVLGGLLQPMFLLAIPDEGFFFPPFTSPNAIRWTMFVISIFWFFVGTGLYRRMKSAWVALHAYIVVGTLCGAWASWAYSYPIPWYIFIGINGPIGLLIYWFGHPAFERIDRHQQ